MFFRSDTGWQSSDRKQWGAPHIFVLGKSEKPFMEHLSSALGLGESGMSLGDSFALAPREMSADLSWEPAIVQ